jgi:hypothetical protein
VDDIDWTKLIRNYGGKTLQVPDDTKHYWIVHTLGPLLHRLQLRHAPSDWVLASLIGAPDPTEAITRLRQDAERRGYVVEDDVALEDWPPVSKRMMRSCER